MLPSTVPDARLQDTQDLVTLLTVTINQVRRGEVDPKVANAVGFLGGLLMKAIHEAEIEKRKADEARRAAVDATGPTADELKEILRQLTPEERDTWISLLEKLHDLRVAREAVNRNGTDDNLAGPVPVPIPDAGTTGAEGGGGGSPEG